MTKPPLNFSITRHDAWRARGDLYWIAGLPDGREVTFHADRVDFTGGVLTATDIVIKEGVPDRDEIVLALPPGSWIHCYAASLMDGAPICVEQIHAADGK